MNDICCNKKMKVTFPPWGTLVGFFHAKFYSKCEVCGKEYLYTWQSCPLPGDLPGYKRRSLKERDKGLL